MARKKKNPTPLVDFSGIAKNLEEAELAQYVEKNFLNYANEVIVRRAIPDARDGLKPVHRRILYAMKKSGYTIDKKHVKSARIVGEVMGLFHPHGDGSIYEAMVGLAQEFNLPLPFIDKYGNFGLKGDSAAAPRYTEARLSAEANLLLEELNEDCVDMTPNYDESVQEPVFLPAQIPNVLINGVRGIAVGMTTLFPPHNPREALNATLHVLDNPNATVDTIMEHMPGPDFPTGGEVIGVDGIKEAYETGTGTFHTRARYRIENQPGGRSVIFFYDLPYLTNAEKCVSEAKTAVESGRLNGITAIDDLTDRNNGVLLRFETERGINPTILVEEIFANTSLAGSFGVIATVIHNNVPVTVGVKDLITFFLDHRRDVVTRRTLSRLVKRQRRLEQVNGLLKVLLDIDTTISIIRAAKDSDTAKTKLIAKFKLTDDQATYVLNLQLRRLTKMDQHALEKEQKELSKEITALTKITSTTAELEKVIRAELEAIRDTVDGERRTTIIGTDLQTHKAQVKELRTTSTVELTDAPCVIAVHASGGVTRHGEYAPQSPKRKVDPVVSILDTTTLSTVVLVTNKGVGYKVEVISTTDGTKVAPKDMGVPLDAGERVIAVCPLVTPEGHTGLALGTKNGVVKVSATDFPKTLDTFPVITLDPTDEVLSAHWVSTPNTYYSFITSDAQLLRFEANKVRTQGSKGGGMAGIKLPTGATALAFAATPEDQLTNTHVITYTGKTIKNTTLDQAPVKGRATAGQRFHAYRKGETQLAFAAIVTQPVVTDATGKPLALPKPVKRDASGTPTETVPTVAGTL